MFPGRTDAIFGQSIASIANKSNVWFIDTTSPVRGGLQQGDVIQEANRQAVGDVAGLNRAMQNSGNQPVLLLIDRNGITIFLVVQSH